jgi:hypothetical protein
MTTRGLLLSLLALSLLALPAFSADPALLKLVPPEATVVGGLNLEQVKASPFGQYLLKQLELDDRDFRELMEATGFDPRRDLKEIVFASDSARRPGHGNGLLVASGQFDPGRIQAAIRAKGAEPTSYAGVDIFIDGKKSPSGGFAFLSASVVVAGDEALVRAAIDRKRKGGSGPSPALAAKASEWSAKADAWIVTTGSPADWSGHVTRRSEAGPFKSLPLDAVEQAAGGIKLGAAATLFVEAVARTEKDATALADVARFLSGMVQLNREHEGAAELAKVIDTLKITSDARVVSLSLSVPEEQLEKMIQSHRDKRAPRKRATI